MYRDKLVDSLVPSGDKEMEGMCEDCIFGKHMTHPFSDTSSNDAGVLDCIYVDIWGPAPVQSAGGAKYFMLLIDSATSYRHVFFLSSKSADTTLNAFREYHVESERQTGRKLKRVQMDMGREWHNALWDKYVKCHGIVLDFATPYAHQQNGKAERSMQTLLDIARAMLVDSGLPQKYWADAVQTAVYMRNFIPSSCTLSKIPTAQWLQLCQDVSHLCPFRSTAYAHIPTEISPSKLSPCSVKLMLIGYYGWNGYKLLDRATGAVYKLRDVIFEKSCPHYSTDPLVTYPNDSDVAHNNQAIAPCPKLITTLHQPSTVQMLQSALSSAHPSTPPIPAGPVPSLDTHTPDSTKPTLGEQDADSIPAC
jgi:hypothetical protein